MRHPANITTTGITTHTGTTTTLPKTPFCSCSTDTTNADRRGHTSRAGLLYGGLKRASKVLQHV